MIRLRARFGVFAAFIDEKTACFHFALIEILPPLSV